ncbi:MAG: hypothetical protein AAB787_02965 [Patescibacteria group bacterium]
MQDTPLEFPHTAWVTFFKHHNSVSMKIDCLPGDLKEGGDFHTEEGMHLVIMEILPTRVFLVESMPDPGNDPSPLDDDIVA